MSFQTFADISRPAGPPDFFARLAETPGPPPAVAQGAAEAALEPETAGSGRWVRYAGIAVILALIVWLATRGSIKF